MRYPNFNEEKKLWKKRYRFVVGLDESGRGPLAGPVVAAAVMIKKSSFKFQVSSFKNVKDSKQLTPKQREGAYKILTTHPQIKWGIGRVSEEVIDKINILEATKLAMRKAIRNLEKKIERKMNSQKKVKKSSSRNSHDRESFGMIEFLIVDGNFSIRTAQPRSARGLRSGMRMRPCECIPQKSIIKADEKVFSCAAASIIAKVSRDRIMKKYHKKYPQYGFDRHKGYPTKKHKRALKKFGACPIHRKSFRPVAEISAL